MAGTRRRNPWKAQDRDTRAHDLIEHYLDTYGLGYEHVIPMAGHDAANEGRLCVKRGAFHYRLSCAAWVAGPYGPCVDCIDPGATHELHFRLFGKSEGREYVVRQTGGDPALLKYNPHARRPSPRDE